MKKISAIIIASLLMACGAAKSTKDKLCGKKWYPTKVEVEGKSQEIPAGDKSFYEFKPYGTLVMGGANMVDSNKYTFDDKTNTVTVMGSDGNPGLTIAVTKVDDKHLEIKQTLISMNVTMNISLETK